MKTFIDFEKAMQWLEGQLVNCSHIVHTEKWQGIDISQQPQFTMREVLNTSFSSLISNNIRDLEKQIKPNLPWADEHFLERIGGKPLNPGNSYKIWPFYKRDKEMRTEAEQFSHSYMERFWPKYAGVKKDHQYTTATELARLLLPLKGIRYNYGDLYDVVSLLGREPYTRQAFLPVWFPEDTGVLHGGRVPCTIGYQFIRRGAHLHMVYYIRSCDFRRHLRDDIYLAARLILWMISMQQSGDYKEHWEGVYPGTLTMHITSLHLFESDYQILLRNH